MESSVISDKVLFIGIDYKHSKGGVPEVEKYYSKLFCPYKFVPTSIDGSKLKKLVVMIYGLLRFLYILSADKSIRIVHVQACSDNSFWRKRIFVNIAKMYSKKVVYHVHSGRFLDFAAEHPAEVKRLIKKCDMVIALSKAWKDGFRERLGYTATVLPNGIYTPMPLEKRPQSKNPVIMSFLGKINDNKGVFDLLQALSLGKGDFSGRLKVKIAGVGETDRLKSEIRDRDIEDITQYVGWVEGEAKEHLLAETQIFILPSHFEGLPVCILEAQSYGIPVIATRVGGIPDIVTDNADGLLISPSNPSEIAAAIKRLLDNPELRTMMGNKGQKKSMNYTPENIKLQLEAIYTKMLG